MPVLSFVRQMKKKKKVKKEKYIIGRQEIVDFPDLEIYCIQAKIDTGAYTSSIHCKDVMRFEERGVDFVSFVLLDPTHPQYENKAIRWPLHEVQTIKNSFGHSEERYSVLAKIRLFNESYEVELSLADRSAMEFPVLLGRKALRNRYIVDVSKVNCSYKQMTKASKNEDIHTK